MDFIEEKRRQAMFVNEKAMGEPYGNPKRRRTQLSACDCIALANKDTFVTAIVLGTVLLAVKMLPYIG